MIKCALLLLAACQESPYVIRVVDEATERGVPLVELRTTGGIRLFTDSAGVVAFDEPGLLGTKVFFHVSSHGYEFPKDGFGYRGMALETRPGQSATLKIKRLNVAERLYRVTGQGIYHHTLRAGLKAPVASPALNGKVVGQDTVMAVPFGGKIRWFWGDTHRVRYPLGHFGTAAATSDLPGKGGLDPSVGINLRYLVDKDGFSRPMFTLGRPGPVWVHGLFVLADPDGKERIVSHYMRMKNLGRRLEHGVAVFREEEQRFVPAVQFDLDAKLYPRGQAFRVRDGGKDYVYFAQAYPLSRVEANWKSVMDPSRYEAFTCLRPGSDFDPEKPALDRENGKVRYAWKTDTAIVGAREQPKLEAEPGELWIRTRDAASGEPLSLHAGSVRWNAFRKRWVMIATREGGPSAYLGDVYYAESGAPHGPWNAAVKILTHDRTTFYNPVHHDFFDQKEGRFIYFEGTYTRMFSKTAVATPRYEYNQIMYRLDLEDPRLEAAR